MGCVNQDDLAQEHSMKRARPYSFFHGKFGVEALGRYDGRKERSGGSGDDGAGDGSGGGGGNGDGGDEGDSDGGGSSGDNNSDDDEGGGGGEGGGNSFSITIITKMIEIGPDQTNEGNGLLVHGLWIQS
ncbi:glycine-rich cell wall structural protein 1.0-like [Lotus japonicus]|uniref:glycine-rich cell wall structural protein 1.0-like n=1 Tax=Lotus japonicus TaxID=34305 RepID=UPI002587F0DA|nr:glycine-rich cell wall structural protein 1.0-like [Lotus japonicus]